MYVNICPLISATLPCSQIICCDHFIWTKFKGIFKKEFREKSTCTQNKPYHKISDEGMGWTTEELWYNSWQEQEILLFFTTYRPFLGPPQQSSQWILRALASGYSSLNLQVNIALFEAEVKNEWCGSAQWKLYLSHRTTCCLKPIWEGVILTTDMLLLLLWVINTWMHLGL
jgi:hypothetical protein